MDGIASYREHAVSTQSRGRLIVLLYEGAIKFLKLAIQAIEAGQVAEKGKYIRKALAIVHELESSLDMETSGEVALNLRRLYDFMDRHLAEANVKHDPQRIRDVIALLEDLNAGWKAITT